MLFSKFKSEKRKYIKKAAGRNNRGVITVNHQGGGQKHLYRHLDWKREYVEGIVTNFEYDPNRSAYLAKVLSKSNSKNMFNYIIAPKGLKVFDKIVSLTKRTKGVALKTGYSSVLSNFEFGDLVHNVEDFPGQGPIFARSAGTFCQVLQQTGVGFVRLKLPSGTQRLISGDARGTFGAVSNEKHKFRIIGKAGRSRWLNKRPSVRGVAMNPVDHPHGGGHGKTKGGRPSVTPWSRPTKGQPTRNPRKKSKRILVFRNGKVNTKV